MDFAYSGDSSSVVIRREAKSIGLVLGKCSLSVVTMFSVRWETGSSGSTVGLR